MNRGAFFKTIEAAYKKFDKVVSIYLEKYLEELQVKVFISMPVFDMDLMDDLVSAEYELMGDHPEAFLTFEYFPIELTTTEDALHPSAKLIFKR